MNEWKYYKFILFTHDELMILRFVVLKYIWWSAWSDHSVSPIWSIGSQI